MVLPRGGGRFLFRACRRGPDLRELPADSGLDVQQIRDGGLLEQIGDASLQMAPHGAQAAVVQARTLGRVLGVGHARMLGRGIAADRAQHLGRGDLLRRSRQHVAAVASADGVDDAAAPQQSQQLGDRGLGQPLAHGHLRQRQLPAVDGQPHDQTHGLFLGLGDPEHVILLWRD